MFNKKAQGISLNFLIIAALALITLIIIALFFTGGIQKIFQRESDVVTASQQELALAKANCQFWCSTGVKDSYENPTFSEAVKNSGKTKCSDFDGLESYAEMCGDCVGPGDCGTKERASQCTGDCTWQPN